MYQLTYKHISICKSAVSGISVAYCIKIKSLFINDILTILTGIIVVFGIY